MESTQKVQINTNLITLTSHIIQQQQQNKQATGSFTILMNAIQTACKFISSHVRKAGLSNLYGLAGDTNSTGDQQKKIDILSNEIFINSLKNSGKVFLMASEEDEHIIEVTNSSEDAHYFVAFDPLDGSSNIDANISIGTIWCIFRRHSHHSEPINQKDIFQKEIISAGYCIYGSSTQIIYSVGKEVNGFTLDPSFGEFILTHPNLTVPNKCNIYSINEGNTQYWNNAVKEYIQSVKHCDKPYSHRYVGSMVADVHRTLLYGGIFMYPADSKSKNGKLRLLYECYPMAYIICQAGGMAIDGFNNILDVTVTNIHQRSPIIIGSQDEVQKVKNIYLKHKDNLYSN